MMEIFKDGTPVKTVTGKIDAIITAACIRNGGVNYELSYFHNGEHKSVWCYSYEFTTDNMNKLKVGFKN